MNTYEKDLPPEVVKAAKTLTEWAANANLKHWRVLGVQGAYSVDHGYFQNPNYKIEDYSVDQWWIKSLEELWAHRKVSDDTYRAARVALNFSHLVLNPKSPQRYIAPSEVIIMGRAWDGKTADIELPIFGDGSSQGRRLFVVALPKPVEQPDESKPHFYCRPCHSYERPSPICWKCGADCKLVNTEEWPLLKNPDVELIKELARQVGYCVAEHGSKQTDIDLVAIPWTEDAVSPVDLCFHLQNGLLNDNGQARLFPFEKKPLGRLATNIQVNGWYKLIDLSITPRVKDDSQI